MELEIEQLLAVLAEIVARELAQSDRDLSAEKPIPALQPEPMAVAA